MQIFIRSIEGQTLPVSLPADATVADLKAAVEIESRLVFAGKSLEDSDNLALLGVVAGSTLFENAELLGGGKKRKKKVYTKPKKVRGPRKKVKLAALKFYKVEGGKVTRLKKECPTCGPGVFMAMHSNRYYCGKCTLTYQVDGGEA
jgi:small subunit ribosomal protein S27Ae